MGAEVVAVNFDEAAKEEFKNFRQKVMIKLIPQFKDAMGCPAAKWAQLYINAMEKDCGAGKRNQEECAFIFSKIKEQHPEVTSGVFQAA